ncbi:cytochrome c oxidase subunit II [Gemmatimonadota bacterium]
MYGSNAGIVGSVNSTFLFMVIVSVFFLVLITALMIGFAIRYRHDRHPKAEQIEGNLVLEIIWTVIPLVLVGFMFWYGFEGFRLMRDVPEDAMIVQVTGRMWDWSFRYENGKTSERLYVPIHQPVKVVLNSVDVNHSFFIPAYRVKEDVVPGRETYLWFKPQSLGETNIFCAEYCGQQHSYMMSEVVVMGDDEFQAWLADEAPTIPEGPGGAVVLERNSCLNCHSLDGTRDTGPSFLGLYGSTQVVIQGSQEVTVTVDETFLRRSIVHPEAERAKGFRTNMPPPVDITEEEIDEIIEYLKTLGVSGGGS